MAEPKTVADVLRKTHETLATAQLGLVDLLGDRPERRVAGIHNVAVFGRSVTLALQNLRAVDRDAFDNWYGPYQQVMAADPLIKFFTNLRNEILKEGPPSVSSSTYVSSLTSADLALFASTSPPPLGSTGMFIGDRFGGSGYVVPTPDGTEQKYYVALPEWMGVQTSLQLPNPPTEHLGQPLVDTSAQALCSAYVAYLTRLVVEAEQHFST